MQAISIDIPPFGEWNSPEKDAIPWRFRNRKKDKRHRYGDPMRVNRKAIVTY